MKAVVLAAGLGTRLRPLTLKMAKPAVPFLNRPLIGRLLAALARAGIHEVAVNLHHAPESVRRAVTETHPPGLRVRFSYEPRILGTSGALDPLRDWLGGERFFLLNSDTLHELDLKDLLRVHEAAGVVATLALCHHPEMERYGTLALDEDGRICRFLDRWRSGRPPAYEGLFIGAHVIEPELLDWVPRGEPSEINRDIYPRLLEAGRLLGGYRYSGIWQDLGTPARYLQGHWLCLDRDGRPGPGSREVEQESEGLVREPCLIAPEARLPRRGRIGPYCVIGPGAVIEEDVRLERCVVWPEARVPRGLELRDCIVHGIAPGDCVRAGKT
jgi:NDP-sugar pyrophosphorylase family protein